MWHQQHPEGPAGRGGHHVAACSQVHFCLCALGPPQPSSGDPTSCNAHLPPEPPSLGLLCSRVCRDMGAHYSAVPPRQNLATFLIPDDRAGNPNSVISTHHGAPRGLAKTSLLPSRLSLFLLLVSQVSDPHGRHQVSHLLLSVPRSVVGVTLHKGLPTGRLLPTDLNWLRVQADSSAVCVPTNTNGIQETWWPQCDKCPLC